MEVEVKKEEDMVTSEVKKEEENVTPEVKMEAEVKDEGILFNQWKFFVSGQVKEEVRCLTFILIHLGPRLHMTNNLVTNIRRIFVIKKI